VVSQTYSPGPGLFPFAAGHDLLKGRGDLFPVGGVGEEKVTVFAGAGGQHQVVALAVDLYALLDKLAHLGLVFGDFSR
jgi:hypothetical protein